MELRVLAFSVLLRQISLAFQLRPKDVCLQQVNEGLCNGDYQRWYYNTLTQECEQFSYSGCHGNHNNFETYEECLKTCWRIPKIPRICRLDKERGPCRSELRRYFFNMTSMACEPFDYGGCNGNSNRFMDMGSCQDYCEPHKSTPAICLGALDAGSCTASIQRYYYNAASKSCEEFLYTGCGGTSNNFVSRQICTTVCIEGKKTMKNYPTHNKIRIKLMTSNRLKI